MGLENEHYNQYIHNLELLSTPSFADSIKYVDWIITIIFYSAVHLIEKELAKAGVDGTSHKEREKMIVRHAQLRNIKDEYNALYMASRKTRYSCRYKLMLKGI